MDIFNDSKVTVTNGGILPMASVLRLYTGGSPWLVPLAVFFGGI